MTPEIRAEWNKHQSRQAQAWLRQMVARRKLVALPSPEPAKELWEALENLAKMDEQRFEIVKDICLLEAALASDRTIISLDENTARRFFHQASLQLKLLRTIVWVNPDKIEAERPIEWLEAGAPADPERMLGH